MIKTTGIWKLKTIHGEIANFYHDHVENTSPFDRIEDFDAGDYWSVDAKEQLNGYETDPEEDSFILVPKSDIEAVWFEKYTDANRPKELKAHSIDDIMDKILK